MKGIFTLSLDFELIWGTLDSSKWPRFSKLCQFERDHVIDALLDLFRQYDVRATWATVGHLMLDRCDRSDGHAHPTIVPPNHEWCRRPWFALDPCTNEASAPVFYGRELVRKILACPVPQEVGCHTFSHVIFGDKGCSRRTAASELAACQDAARGLGIKMKSFVFPRNRIGHLDLVEQSGFTCYRGNAAWYEQPGSGRLTRRAAHLWEIIARKTPPTVVAKKDAHGLWNIPGSMLYTPSHGVRRWIPVSWRVARACNGLAEAAATGRIFHLWFHPTDVVVRSPAMLEGLRQILECASELRDRGKIEIASMGEIAERAERLMNRRCQETAPVAV